MNQTIIIAILFFTVFIFIVSLYHKSKYQFTLKSISLVLLVLAILSLQSFQSNNQKREQKLAIMDKFSSNHTEVQTEKIPLHFLTEYYKNDSLENGEEFKDREGFDGYQIIELTNTYEGELLVNQKAHLLEIIQPVNQRILIGSDDLQGINDGRSKQTLVFINSERANHNFPYFIWDEQLYQLAHDLIIKYIKIHEDITYINEDGAIGYMVSTSAEPAETLSKITSYPEVKELLYQPNLAKTALVSYTYSEQHYLMQLFYEDEIRKDHNQY